MEQIESRWWMWHFVLLLSWPIFAGLFLSWEYLGARGMQDLALYALAPYFLFSIVAVFASWQGYYVEARQLEAAGSEWVPRPHRWTLIHVLISPYIAAPFYLIERHHNIGVDWSALPVVNGRLRSA